MKSIKVFLLGVAFMLLGGTLSINALCAKAQQLCYAIVIIIDDTLSCPTFPNPYPNPSSDGLHLNFYDDVSGDVEIEAKDANGNSVYEQTITISGGGNIVLPCDTWENGIYTIWVSANGCTRRLTAKVYR